MKRHSKEFIEIIIGVALLIAAVVLDKLLKLPWWGGLLLFLVPYIFAGHETLGEAFYGITHGQVFDENFLMSIATVGALATGDYPEAVFVMLFYKIGELFEHIAVGRSRDSIAGLMEIMPEYANLETDEGIVETDLEEVILGSVIVIKPGEKVPLDGIVLSGSSGLNTMALTGESLPRDVSEGDKVISGCINLNGMLRVRTTCEYTDSTVARILELVENSAESKAKTENFITRFARVYTPAVVICAAALAIIPPLFTGGWTKWIYRGLTFLVISCPCALVISVPLAFFGGIGRASRRGILVKGSSYLEALAMAETMVFDKTGTLTEGSFGVSGRFPVDMDEKELLRLGAAAEYYSDHPIAHSIVSAYDGEIDVSTLDRPEELAGMGIRAMLNGKELLAGNLRLMESVGIVPQNNADGTIVHIAYDGRYAGCIAVSDRVKPEAKEALAALKASGIRNTVMLSGDRQRTADKVASELGIGQAIGELLPGDKVERLEELISRVSENGRLVYVGDGINDAPVLTRADVGIAMGALGSDAAIEAADIVIMDDNLSRLPEAIDIARRTRRIVRQNIILSLGVKGIILILGALGFAGMWAAVFGDVGIMVIAVLNSMRLMK